MENVLDHVDHIVRLAGVEHVGLGSDRDLDGFDVKADLDGVHLLEEGLRPHTRTAAAEVQPGRHRAYSRQEFWPGAADDLEFLKPGAARATSLTA